MESFSLKQSNNHGKGQQSYLNKFNENINHQKQHLEKKNRKQTNETQKPIISQCCRQDIKTSVLAERVPFCAEAVGEKPSSPAQASRRSLWVSLMCMSNDTCCWFSKPTWMNYTPPSPYAGQSLLRSLPSTGALRGTDVLPRLGLHTHPQEPTLTDVPRLSLVLQSGLISLPPLPPFAISNMTKMSLSDPLTSSLSLLPLKPPV